METVFKVTIKSNSPILCRDIKEYIKTGIHDKLNVMDGYVLQCKDDPEEKPYIKAIIGIITDLEDIKVKVNYL